MGHNAAEPPSRPEVEAIVEDIRRTVREAEDALAAQTEAERDGPSLDELQDAARAQGNLYENLAAANEHVRVGAVPPTGGIKGRVQLRVYDLIHPLVEELNAFHTSLVRVLNKLVQIFDGQDTQVSSELLMKTQQRVDLLTQLCDRLSALDDLQIDERLKRIEQRLDALDGREPS